jgi:hypothetical protein
MKRIPGDMRHSVKRFKSLAVGLKELEPFIRSGEHLESGRPFKQLAGMRSREAVANWLLCAVANFEHGSERMSFTSDPTGGDGVIHDSVTQETWQTEHVMVRQKVFGEQKAIANSAESLILEQVMSKHGKGGAEYAKGKHLIVFLYSGLGEWFPNKVARSLPHPLLFEDVWVVGLHGPVVDEYVYSVSRLDLSDGDAPTWLVKIGRDFNSWAVSKVR